MSKRVNFGVYRLFTSVNRYRLFGFVCIGDIGLLYIGFNKIFQNLKRRHGSE